MLPPSKITKVKKETKIQELERRVKLLETKADFPLHIVVDSHCGNCNGCPPHNFVPFQYMGSWSGIVPPPTERCTKCNKIR